MTDEILSETLPLDDIHLQRWTWYLLEAYSAGEEALTA